MHPLGIALPETQEFEDSLTRIALVIGYSRARVRELACDLVAKLEPEPLSAPVELRADLEKLAQKIERLEYPPMNRAQRRATKRHSGVDLRRTGS